MASLPTSRRRSKTPRRASAPARLAGSPNPKYRRTRSASPGVRKWNGPRRQTPRRSVKRGPGRFTRSLVALLALSGATRGNTPMNKMHFRTALAPWPLGGQHKHNVPLSKTYYSGKLPARIEERTRPPAVRTFTGGRKMFPGREVALNWVEPNVKLWKVPRKFMAPSQARLPVVTPRATSRNILALNLAGFKVPKSMLNQARAGKPIIGNIKGPMIVFNKLHKMEKKLTLPK